MTAVPPTPAPTTRQRILDEAVTLFLDGGYAAGSLRMIADRVGITQAAVYYHFPAKDDLLAELFEPPLAGYEALLDEVEARLATEGTVDRRALLGAVFEHVREHRDVVRLAESDVTVAAHPLWEPRSAALRRRCVRLLCGAPADPDPAADVLAAAALAVLVRPLTHHLDGRDEARELLLDAAMRVLDTPHRAWPHQAT